MLEGETLRGIERDVRDLVLSLRALTALLKNEAATDDREEAVLARILDAEMNQLVVLVGEMTTALRMEERGVQPKSLDLMQALHHAARRSAVNVVLRRGEPVRASGDPEVVSQIIQSALAIAVRMSERRVTTRAETTPGGGCVIITVSDVAHAARRRDARIALLRRMIGMLGGRLSVDHRDETLRLKLFFPSEEQAREQRTG